MWEEYCIPSSQLGERSNLPLLGSGGSTPTEGEAALVANKATGATMLSPEGAPEEALQT